MTNKEIIAKLKGYKGIIMYPTDEAEALKDMAIQALSQEPCDAAVSRILKRMWNCRGKHTTSIDKVKMEQIIRDELPSVTQKSGKWLDREEYDADRWKCSVCGRTEQYQERYCPNCGAKMESEE